MNLNHYQVFVTVAEYGNFSKAAHKLFMSQPAVSQIISQLESELDCHLFVRQNRGVELTQEGRDFYQLVKIGLENLYQARHHMEELKDLNHGTLRIAGSDTISRYILPKRLKNFSKIYPGIRMQIKNGTSGQLQDMLSWGQVDVVLGFEPKNQTMVDFYPLMTLHESFVAAKVYAQVLPEKITAQNISQAKLMMLDRKSQTRQAIDAHLLKRGIRVQPDIELANYELLAEFARQGLGMAILARELVEDLVILETDIKLPQRQVGFYITKNMPLSHAAKAFMDFVSLKDM
ncbi:LysR family transcriptional regulator [Eremococcus coleocola]|uniref:LysR substrate binding domain protein n=1 Tax=Eremococcus coleocola ACS-139-V-Col8 TaxID=908337 RepID=E4KLR4_9LACT|nr:LysR family transcriptional regulator [Eremococcus coleocola]EFR31973.1 LysR substrate binding domain protein [Eremococcus coleocola ACS-139-V-Col8]